MPLSFGNLNNSEKADEEDMLRRSAGLITSQPTKARGWGTHTHKMVGVLFPSTK